MIRTLATGLIAASTLLLAGAPADAQDRYYETWRGQRDVPGDFRCDAFWDRGRTDCDAAWRDQRSWSQRRHDGYSGYDHGRRWNRAHYGRQNRHGYGYGYGHDRWRHGGGVTAYYGAYGRPDLVTGESYGYAHIKKGGWMGQKQVWFAFRFTGDDAEVDLDAHGEKEFDAWRWERLEGTPPLTAPFKRAVYEKVAEAFAPFAEHKSPGLQSR